MERCFRDIAGNHGDQVAVFIRCQQRDISQLVNLPGYLVEVLVSPIRGSLGWCYRFCSWPARVVGHPARAAPVELYGLGVERLDKLAEGALARPVCRQAAIKADQNRRQPATGYRLPCLGDFVPDTATSRFRRICRPGASRSWSLPRRTA